MSRRRIIAAESEASTLIKLKEMLFRAGFNVVGEATDGTSVLQMAQMMEPDLVVLEASLSGIGGLETARILEEEGIPSLILTNKTGRDWLQMVRDSYFISILVKPIRLQQLYTAVELAIANQERFEKLESQLEELRQTLASRKVIERAKSILMHSKKITENEAHKLLQQLSMKRRCNMKDISMAIITAHELNRE